MAPWDLMKEGGLLGLREEGLQLLVASDCIYECPGPFSLTPWKLSQNKAHSDFALKVNLPPGLEIHPVWGVDVLPPTSHTSLMANIIEPNGHGDGGFHRPSLLEVGHSSDVVSHG